MSAALHTGGVCGDVDLPFQSRRKVRLIDEAFGWFQIRKCDDLQFLNVLCHCKVNIVGVWTVGHSKQDIFTVLIREIINILIHDENDWELQPY